ncbi:MULTISPECIES: DUF397 domain-containing protein [unclassified Streptomyces]|uniref:DUF397 domain-containing protein n=1 Tax=unclassified Streptomyces TaxID=2593676 RepID=UPI0005A7E09D|nr:MULTISPECIES: DUF397 domain-containing protein [unclassified Streptomyces]ODA74114.1 hypothetical protein APS67_001661 [Streptomyces sp. AVP053U2]WAX80123.1 DUF397 domain-containing protein [Streptomyces sp. KMM 9044]
MSAESFRQLVWRKSSYSGNEGGECVEVAVDTVVIHVRDSKDVHRPHLSVRADGWATFVAFAAAG